MDMLERREIEARIVGPLLEALGKEFDRERVLAIARDVIVQAAAEQGRQLASQTQNQSLSEFSIALDAWKQGGALEMEMLEQNDERLSFNVTRCRYAELYRALGLEELGGVLSCNRDFALIEGYNPDVKLTRTQTIMEGAPYCNFRFERQK